MISHSDSLGENTLEILKSNDSRVHCHMESNKFLLENQIFAGDGEQEKPLGTNVMS